MRQARLAHDLRAASEQMSKFLPASNAVIDDARLVPPEESGRFLTVGTSAHDVPSDATRTAQHGIGTRFSDGRAACRLARSWGPPRFLRGSAGRTLITCTSLRIVFGQASPNSRRWPSCISAACASLSADGVVIRLLGGTFFPVDEALSRRYEGTEQAVRAAHENRRAALRPVVSCCRVRWCVNAVRRLAVVRSLVRVGRPRSDRRQ